MIIPKIESNRMSRIFGIVGAKQGYQDLLKWMRHASPLPNIWVLTCGALDLL
jgi:hypothetical protein